MQITPMHFSMVDYFEVIWQLAHEFALQYLPDSDMLKHVI